MPDKTTMDTPEAVEDIAETLEFYPAVSGLFKETAAMLRRLHARAEAAERERDDLQSTFNVRWQADMRAIKRWQAESKGRDLKWPDHVDLVCWLAEQLATARADALREAIGIANERGSWASNDLDADSLKDRLEANGRMDMAKEIAAAILALINHPTTTGET